MHYVLTGSGAEHWRGCANNEKGRKDYQRFSPGIKWQNAVMDILASLVDSFGLWRTQLETH